MSWPRYVKVFLDGKPMMFQAVSVRIEKKMNGRVAYQLQDGRWVEGVRGRAVGVLFDAGILAQAPTWNGETAP